MLIYEMCEKGTLKDFLVANKANVTVDLQDNLYRFGLDIAKGMEHLASKQVHIKIISTVQLLVVLQYLLMAKRLLRC